MRDLNLRKLGLYIDLVKELRQLPINMAFISSTRRLSLLSQVMQILINSFHPFMSYP